MHVEFAGHKYYPSHKYGYYLSRKGPDTTLQRAVWRDTYGNIPHGWHVHHKPGTSKATVDVDDLECLAPLDHFRLHREQRMANTCYWPRPPQTFACEVCGVEYEAKANPAGNKYCSNRCNLRAYRARRKGSPD